MTKTYKIIGVSPTGFFGAKTEEAIKKFQKSNGLDQTGFIDNKTYSKIIN